MSSYQLSIFALLLALMAQAGAAGLSIECYLRKDLSRAVSRTWLALAIASVLLALHHGYALELAVRTGLHDFRQALLLVLVGIFFGLGAYGFRRQQA